MTQRLEYSEQRIKNIFNRIKNYCFKVEFDVYFNNEARYLSYDFYRDNWQANWKTTKYPFLDDVNLIYECTTNNLHREMAKEVLYQRKRMYDYKIDITKRFEKIQNMFGVDILELDENKFIDLLKKIPFRLVSNTEEFSDQKNPTQFELINELIGFDNYCTITWGKAINNSRYTMKDIKDKFDIQTRNGRRYFNFNIEYSRLILWNIFFCVLSFIFLISVGIEKHSPIPPIALVALLTFIFTLLGIPLGSWAFVETLYGGTKYTGILEKLLFFFGFLPYNFIKEDVHNPLEKMYDCNVDLLNKNGCGSYIQIEHRDKVK